MGLSLAYLMRGSLLAALAFAVVYSAPAQHTFFRPGQPIVFSSPESTAVASNMPSLTPKPPGALDLDDVAPTPATFDFNRLPQPTMLPFGLPPVSPLEAARLRELQDRRNNWMLLTPAEIMGAATPESILGIPERDAFGRPKNPTALERYNERQSQLVLLAQTNALQMGNSLRAWDEPDAWHGMSNSINGGLRNPEGPSGAWLNSTPDQQTLSQQNENSGWSKLFAPPTPAPLPDTAQQAEMEQFRQLLNPGLSSATPSSDGIKTSLPQTLLGSAATVSSPSRAAASFIPLTDGIGKPPELPKLPGAWNLNYTSSPPAAAWSPQLAPWLSPSPQPLAAPQRKF